LDLRQQAVSMRYFFGIPGLEHGGRQVSLLVAVHTGIRHRTP
jgi:hypothetical protein